MKAELTGEKRVKTILSALAAELERQAGEPGGRLRLSGRLEASRYVIEGEIDLAGLARAVNDALAGRLPATPREEGRKTDELNAANDL